MEARTAAAERWHYYRAGVEETGPYVGEAFAATRRKMMQLICMSGRYAVKVAVRHSDKIRAAASIYGTALVSDDPESQRPAYDKAAAERHRERLFALFGDAP